MKDEGPNKPERRKLAEDGDVADSRETAFFFFLFVVNSVIH